MSSCTAGGMMPSPASRVYSGSASSSSRAAEEAEPRSGRSDSPVGAAASSLRGTRRASSGQVSSAGAGSPAARSTLVGACCNQLSRGCGAHEPDCRVCEAVEQRGVADAELSHEFGEYRLVNGTVIDDFTQPIRWHEQRGGGEAVRAPLRRCADREDVALDDDPRVGRLAG